MPPWLLKIDVVGGPVPLTIWGLTAVLALVLLIRRPTGRWVLTALIGILAGALLGVGGVLIADRMRLFDAAMPQGAAWWAGGGLAVLALAIVSLWDSKAWRKIVAIVTILLTLLSTALGINALFGIDRTIGDIVGESTVEAIGSLPAVTPEEALSGPLYENWTPPADMPAKGTVSKLTGADAIPSSAGYKPRDAIVYLPPAALVKDPPHLPFAIQMMGKPGNPDPTFIQNALDKMAAENKGLAPIVIIADQLGGDRTQDPVCMDSPTFGGAETYFNKDIPAFALERLNVVADKRSWSMMGYSNGGACALKWAAKYPETWGHLVDVSGDPFPGVDADANALDGFYGGDKKKYDADKPAAYLAAGKETNAFAGHHAIFTAGEKDPVVNGYAQENAKLAADAGFTVSTYVIPGADHNETAIDGGMPMAFGVLYPLLGLSAPTG
ncbi:enterochelin esterase-like enzyme [Microbacterium resistens]|uniref:Enterochelin esterase-like enzyme n=1 Tax=Microbacterium resistens TaxID=156977 RepID=A0ABU1SDA3_9MICO|nr:esterase [Microbacterium resistens]MDR6867228.1 enterochelin esterase-like enzyme [Microbacterium resistens]